MAKPKCVIILSEKSSGSSACQSLLAKHSAVRHVERTRHFENETLYWTKAASLLGLPQLTMVDSEVPIAQDRARADLIQLLTENLENYTVPDDDETLIFHGWQQLCRKYSPIFVEKSPHHLCQWAALELILQCMERHREAEYLLIGLVRNPMDVIYSQFTRWGTRPEQLERQWLTAYENLERLKKHAAERLVIVRYEDMVSSLDCMQPVFAFCGVELGQADRHYFHSGSISKWKADPAFGFVLSDAVAELAGKYGYTLDDTSNASTLFWPCYRECARAKRKLSMMSRNAARNLIDSMKSVRRDRHKGAGV